MEDFVRWYSPRDYIESEDLPGGQTGELSARMKIPGNMWIETWDTAKSCPARRQRRLFDDTTEAEKVRAQTGIKLTETLHDTRDFKKIRTKIRTKLEQTESREEVLKDLYCHCNIKIH